MTTHETGAARRLGGCLIFLLILLVLGVFFAIDYLAGLALLLGIVLAWPIRWILVGLSRWLGRGLVALVVVSITILTVLLYGMFVVYAPEESPQVGIAGVETLFTTSITGYRLKVEPATPEMGLFNVTEEIRVADRQAGEQVMLALPVRQVDSRELGFLLREVAIAPLQVDENGQVTLTLPNGAVFNGPLCSWTCPEATVELLDFPPGAFYEAQEAEKLQIYPYVEKETVAWTVHDLERGINFAYLPPPFHYARSLLEPFTGLTSWSGWAIALLGIFGTVFINPLLESVLSDVVRDQGKALARRVFGKKAQDSTHSK